MIVPTPRTEIATCPICVETDRLAIDERQASKRKDWKQVYILSGRTSALDQAHPKCRKCGIRFGGSHMGTDVHDGMCQRCSRKYAPKVVANA